MLTKEQFLDLDQWNDENSYGEPQLWLGFTSGRSFEVTYEMYMLSHSEYFVSIRYNCSSEEYDNGDFHATNGLIDVYNYSTLEEGYEAIFKLMKLYKEELVVDDK